MARSTSRPAITTAVARRRARTIASCAYGRDGSSPARSESRQHVTQSTIYQRDYECMPRERLERLTLEHMRATVARVRENPAWVKRLGGVRSEDLAHVEDWRRLPFLTKEELRDAYPFGLACGRDYRRIQMSSGTTGNPILNPYTAADIEQWGEVMARCCVAAGVTARDVIQITPSFGLFTGGFGFHYGAERLGAMIVPVGAGIHVWDDHYHVEIVDPASGRVLPDGVEGELVVSALTREGLPLVRYRTHDLTRIVSRAACDCGRTVLRLDRLRGRTDDMVIFKGVNFYPRQIEQVLLRQPGLSHDYQIVLDADGGGERMTVMIEAEPGCDAVVATRVRRELHDLLSLSPDLKLCRLGEIERAQGKAVRVVDLRAQGRSRARGERWNGRR